MTKITKKYLKRLRFMYLYTLIGAGGFGIAIIISPDVIQSLFKMPAQDPLTFGITGSVYLAFGILSILGLIFPIKLIPVLMLQLLYKTIWLFGIMLPVFLKGQFELHAVLVALIFLTYIIGDLVSIPFKYLFEKEQKEII